MVVGFGAIVPVARFLACGDECEIFTTTPVPAARMDETPAVAWIARRSASILERTLSLGASGRVLAAPVNEEAVTGEHVRMYPNSVSRDEVDP